MAAPQSAQYKSYPEKVRDDYRRLEKSQRQSVWIGLIVSLLIGILIGWFLLGWGLFPVRYAGGAPHQLDQAAQADYISSVADAYSARLDEESLALAAYRLRAFLGEGSLDEAIQNAIDYFNATPGATVGDQYPTAVNFDSRVRIKNLETLRTDLGVAATETVAAATAATASTTQKPPDQKKQKQGRQESQGLNWLKWLLGLLAALVLLYGGLKILRLLTRREDDNGGGSDRDASTTITDASYEVRPHTTTAGQQPDANRRTIRANRSDVPTDDYDPARKRWEDEAGEEETPAHVLAPTVDPSEHPDYSFSNEGEETIEEPAASSPVAEDDDADWEDGAGWVTDMGMTTAASSLIANREKPAATPANPARKGGREVVATYTAHYQLGQSDYDEAFSLIDPQTQANLGDCGMGVTSPGGYRDNRGEEAIALTAWLFDKMDNERIGNHQRVLISEYVIDQKKEADYENIRGVVGKPIVAQPGLEFTIEGESLLMTCRVLEAGYIQNGASKGVFKDVKVEMSVMKKG